MVPLPTYQKSLASATHIWVRVDRVRSPLQTSYQGLYVLKELAQNTVTIARSDGKLEVVSMPRLKLAILVKPSSAFASSNSGSPHQSTEFSQKTPVLRSSPQPAKMTITR